MEKTSETNEMLVLATLVDAIQKRKNAEARWKARTGKDLWHVLLDEWRAAEANEELVFQNASKFLEMAESET